MLELILNSDYTQLKVVLMARTAVVFVSMLLVVVACLLDFWSGCSAAKALGQRLNSHGFRKTMDKIADYFKVMLVGISIDILGSVFPWYDYPYASILVCAATLIIEGKSVFENSRRKKARAGEIPQIIAKIIEAKNGNDATAIIRELGQLIDAVNKNEKWQEQTELALSSHPPEEKP